MPVANSFGLSSREDLDRMKKIVSIVFLLIVCAAAGRAQESRQDISLSGTVLLEPFKEGTTDVSVAANRGFGALLSYRFMLTPTAALEANYGIDYHNMIHYVISNTNHYDVCVRNQEISAAFVKSFVFKNFNPFLEAGPGGMIFLPIRDACTQSYDVKQQMEIGVMYGGGIAYEVSPSFDIRMGYRAFTTKVPTLGDTQFNTNRWYTISVPMIGVAYHF
jgi:outer membrane immunogenic protein